MHTLEDCLSPLAQLSQTTAEFDFPRTSLPGHFSHVGPLRRPSKSDHAFNVKPDPERPFVFASFGTLQGGRFNLFMRITRACKALRLQLLLAHCNLLNGLQEEQLRSAGATWVTGFTDQQAAIEKADVVVTHGGLNTTLDALAAGTPLLVLPIAFDQPGVSARVARARAGLRLSPRWASQKAISAALRRLVSEPEFAQQAQRLGKGIAQAGGVSKAARIVLSAVANGPVVKASKATTSPVLFAERQLYAT